MHRLKALVIWSLRSASFCWASYLGRARRRALFSWRAFWAEPDHPYLAWPVAGSPTRSKRGVEKTRKLDERAFGEIVLLHVSGILLWAKGIRHFPRLAHLKYCKMRERSSHRKVHGGAAAQTADQMETTMTAPQSKSSISRPRNIGRDQAGSHTGTKNAWASSTPTDDIKLHRWNMQELGS